MVKKSKKNLQTSFNATHYFKEERSKRIIKYFKLILLIILFFNSLLFSSECKKCHDNIEPISKAHNFKCIKCHGGDNSTNDKEKAHAKMFGNKNPSSPQNWNKICGECHEYQVRRVETTIMFTNTGIIKNTTLAWGEEYKKIFSSLKKGKQEFNRIGEKVQMLSVIKDRTITGELYRKFCSMCHVGENRNYGFKSYHSSGCAACHFSYNNKGIYTGKDKQIYNKKGYSTTHKMNALPDDKVCFRCHHRSGRISLSYEGLYDGNNSLVPTHNGYPGPELITGKRNLRHIPEDIHKKYGMECIDCHTSRELMGEGYIYNNMYEQTEITCEDCHGTGTTLPQYSEITLENEAPLLESKNYAFKIKNGMKMVLTSKKRKFSNVFYKNGKFYLFIKRKGKLLEIKTIKGDAKHKIAGHEKMECYTCHSKTVQQCYGCHTYYDKRRGMKDRIKGNYTMGYFFEKEDYRTLFPFPLAYNQRGKISPATPGCQTFLSIIEQDGRFSKKEYIFKLKKGKIFKYAPFFSHNIGEKAISCKECHGNLFFTGFGTALISLKNKRILSISKDSLDAIIGLKNGRLKNFSIVVREKSRPFTKKEIVNFFKANLCIICHDKGEEKYYGKKVDYNILNDRVHKKLVW